MSVRGESEAVHPWDSDHTALVHVIWASGIDIPTKDADELATQIMRSKWMRAVRQHAREAVTSS